MNIKTLSPYTRTYLQFFGFGEQSLILCENCINRAGGIHHLVFKSHGGGNEVTNCMALCYKCHEKTHNDKTGGFNDHLMDVHIKRIENYLKTNYE